MATQNRRPGSYNVKGAHTAGNVALTGAQTLGGVAHAAGDITVLTAQTAPAENGPWVVRAGAWDRIAHYNTLRAGDSWFVESGDHAGKTYQLTTPGAITLGTTSLTIAQAGGGGMAGAAHAASHQNGGSDVLTSHATTQANKVWAGPATGADAGPSFRVLTGADMPVAVLGAGQALAGAGAGNLTTPVTYLTASGAGQVVSLADGAFTGQVKRFVAVSGYNGTNTSVVTPVTGPAVTLRSLRDVVEYEWTGAAWVIRDLRLAQVKYSFTGNNGAAARTATGAKVGDRIVAVIGWVTATGVFLGPNTGDFESVVSVADQIQQTATDLSANSYYALVEPRS